MRADRAIRNGTIVTPDMTVRVDLAIVGETVAQIGGEIEADETIDASGLLVLPGGIDAHVHLSNPPGEVHEHMWVDDFESGSRAALAGGITTIGNMTFPGRGESPFDSLDREEALAREQAIADVFLHPVLEEISDRTLREVPRLPERGCNSIKIFEVTPEFDRSLPRFVEAIALAGRSGVISLLHCEDHALIAFLHTRLAAENRLALRHYPESAPPVTEVIATQRAVAIAEVTGSPVYIVHLSSAGALQVCVEAQSRGLPVYVETRPLYLHLTAERFEEEEAGKYTGQPPLRHASDVLALWAGIRQGTVHTVCSDHAPYALAAKVDPNHTIANLRAGVENLQFLRPMLYSEGVRAGQITLARFVEVTATNAAKLFGLFPRKGTIAPGSDADLVLFDPNRTQTIDRAMLQSNVDYSVYEGWEVTGWPVLTVRRGEIVYRDGEVLGWPGSSRIVPRGATQPL